MNVLSKVNTFNFVIRNKHFYRSGPLNKTELAVRY